MKHVIARTVVVLYSEEPSALTSEQEEEITNAEGDFEWDVQKIAKKNGWTYRFESE